MPQEENIKNLNIILGAMSADHLGKADFQADFKKLIAFVKKIKELNAQELATIKQTLNVDFSNLKGSNNTNSESLKKEVYDLVTSRLNDLDINHKRRMSDVDFKMANVRDGVDADEKKILKRSIKAVLKEIKIPSIKEIIKGLKAKVIRDLLESLEGKDRLRVTAISGLSNYSKSSHSHVAHGGVNFGGVIQHDVSSEELSGTKNSVNKIFTINYTPSPATTLKVYRGGARQQLNPAGTTDGDYSYSANTITFNIAPVSGEILLCDYVR